jgi:hypothetical protein
MPQGYIYKITCIKDNTFYIGSTTRSVLNRLSYHKQSTYSKRSSKFYRYYDEIGWENVKIKCIDELFFENKLELYILETKYILNNIQNPNCLNTNFSFDFKNNNISEKMILELSISEIINEFNNIKKRREYKRLNPITYSDKLSLELKNRQKEQEYNKTNFLLFLNNSTKTENINNIDNLITHTF